MEQKTSDERLAESFDITLGLIPDRVAELKRLLTSTDLTTVEKQEIIDRVATQFSPKEMPADYGSKSTTIILDRDWLKTNWEKECGQKIQIFQNEVNRVFDAPRGNPWQATLAGMMPISAAVSGANKSEKIKKNHTTTISASNVTQPTQQTASYVGETKDGRVMTVVSGSDKSADMAASVSRRMALYPGGALLSLALEEQIETLVPGHDFAAVRAFHAKGGRFDVVGVSAGKTMIIAYNPNKPLVAERFSTLAGSAELKHGAQHIDESLAEGSIVLCLTKEILEHLPKIPSHFKNRGVIDSKFLGMAIEFDKLLADPDFLPEKITESTLMAALVNYAAKAAKLKRQPQPNATENQLPEKGDSFFLVGMELSNELETKAWLSPANWTPWVVAALGIGFGLKIFTSGMFMTAAPALTGIVVTGVALAAVALIAYVVVTAIMDMQNQWKSRKVETPGTTKQDEQTGLDKADEPENSLDHTWNYFEGISTRLDQWRVKHPVQFTMGVIATALMFAIVGLALWWILNPLGMDATVAGHGLKLFFDFVANTLSSSTAGSMLEFGVDSVMSKVLVTLVTALSSVVVLDSIRRLGAYLYETYADESTAEMDSLMAQDGAPKVVVPVDSSAIPKLPKVNSSPLGAEKTQNPVPAQKYFACVGLSGLDVEKDRVVQVLGFSDTNPNNYRVHKITRQGNPVGDVVEIPKHSIYGNVCIARDSSRFLACEERKTYGTNYFALAEDSDGGLRYDRPLSENWQVSGAFVSDNIEFFQLPPEDEAEFTNELK